MVRKSFALFGLALVIIAGMIMVSACTGTGTPTAAPSATPSAVPSVTPTAPPSNNTTVTMASYGQSDNNTTVSAKNGETFKISLEDNPSTGYVWNVSVTSGLTIVNNTYLPPNTTLVGAPGIREWQVTVNGTGTQQFSGIYKRPLEPLIGNETTYLLNVKIA